MKIQQPFMLGLLGGLGVLVAVVLGASVASLATLITYIFAAFFLALGIDPLVSWLQSKGSPRWLAILIVITGILGVLAGLVVAIIPVVVDQISRLIEAIPGIITAFEQNPGIISDWWERSIPWLSFDDVLANVQKFVTDNIGAITGGVVNTAIGIASGTFGALIVLILMLYFIASLSNIKRAFYQLVPASRREGFIDISEQIADSVGRYVVGQGLLGVCNGVISYLMLTIIGWIIGAPIEYSALLAFIAFIGSLIPLVGTISGAVVISLSVWLFNGFPAVLIVAIWYLIYMQIEAYIFSPNIMKRAVSVPGAAVVIAALAGGTLLGLLGALVAIPTAAAIILIIKQVLIPRQNTR